MKAITVTAEHKENNPKLFSNNTVGEIIKFNPPNLFFRNEERVIEGVRKIVVRQTIGYNFNTELQQIDGVKEISVPKYNAETHKLGKLIDDVEKYTYEVVALTQEEIAQREDAKIPATLSKLAFKTRLLTRHGITDATVEDLINNLPKSEGETEAQLEVKKYKLRLMYFQADFFERSNPYLYQFAPALGLTKADIINLFKDQPNDE